MKRILFLLGLTGLTFGVLTAERPNFVFILVDDLGANDMGYAGSTFYETPHIDRLAASGMRFDQGYASCQVCSPSRASIMLGTAPPRNDITNWIGAQEGFNWDRDDPVLPPEYTWELPHEETTIAEALRDAGYDTFFAGKWHLGGFGSYPQDHGFNTNIGGWHRGSPHGGFFAPYNNPFMRDGPAGESLTHRLAKDTADYIRANDGEPFFAFLSFYTVHSPLQTTKELHQKYVQKAQDMGLELDRERFIFDRRLPVRQVQDHPIYAGMIEQLDDAVGLVLEALADTGLDENTVVIFTSDNGGVTTGDHFSTSLLPMRGGKGRQWEGGIREPFIVHVPGMTPAGSSSDEPVIGMDFYPTMLELAGLPLMPTQHQDGVSLVPLLEGGEIGDRDLFWHYPHYGNQGGEPSSMIRSDDWKLIYYHEDGRWELYNLAEDLGEQHDVADLQPGIVNHLQPILAAWLEETGAKFPARDPRYTEEAFAAKLKHLSTTRMEQLEKQHRAFRDPDWEPNSETPWWGSDVVD